jgi:hypothetical protein
VPQKESREVILEFLIEKSIPMTPKQAYGGLIFTRDITFSYRHVQDVFSEFGEAGILQRVEIDTKAGEVNQLESDGNRGYYVPVETARAIFDEEYDI